MRSKLTARSAFFFPRLIFGFLCLFGLALASLAFQARSGEPARLPRHDTGSIDGGWSITLITATPVFAAAPTPTPTASPTPTATLCAFTENFDGVVAPALPTGWIPTNAQGPGPLWITSTTTPDTAPNAAFIDDPPTLSDKRLDTTGILIISPAAQVSFRHSYAFEPILGGPFYFDGGVLEVSSPNIAGGAFTDITDPAVDGSFVTGGYNGPISTAFSNPIGGRLAWGQSSNGYINTVANLGPNLVGQTIKLRFRMGSDANADGQGWRIDSLSVSGVACTPCGALGPWTGVTNYPVVVEDPVVGSNGVFAYSAGGYSGGATNGFYRFDPVANNWTALATMPTSLYAGRGVYAADTDSFYVFGGYDGTNVLSTTYRYDVAANTWSVVAPLPAARMLANVVYYAATGKIYVVGGFDNGFVETTQTWEYDPVANTWNTTRANLPLAMAGSGTSIAGQFIYLTGTYNAGSGSTLHYRYDIIANAWASMAPAPVSIYVPATGVINGKIYLVGGGNPFRPAPGPQASFAVLRSAPAAPDASYSSTYIYDIASNSWSSGPNTNTPHAFTAGTAIGNRLLVIGGSVNGADTYIVETNVVGSCPCPSARVLIVYADSGTPPTSLPAELSVEPSITSVSLFDGQAATPTLAQLQQYEIVVPWSNAGWLDQTTLGNNLGSYLAGGGIVVAFNFDWFGGTQSILGTWATTYSPYNNSASTNFTSGSLGTCTFGPLCSGITTLNSSYRETMTLASGATLAATWSDGSPLVAYKGRAVGVSAYVGDRPHNHSGQFSHLIANAGTWLIPPCATPTPIPVSIAGNVTQCSSPAPASLAAVKLILTGTSSATTFSSVPGNYSLTNLVPGGNYTVTPSKADRAPASSGINTTDVIAIQRHFLAVTPLTGCHLTAADCAPPAGISTIDIVAAQRFFLGLTSGTGNVGKYNFTPASRSYSPLTGDQTSQNFDAIVFGDVATPFANP